MLQERDYVMRAVKQLADMLIRLLKLKTEKRYDEAAAMLEEACVSVLGIDFAALSLVDSPSAAGVLQTPDRVRIFARLLEELAQVYLGDGDEAKARSRNRHALEMYLEALKLRPADAEAREGVARVRNQVDVELLPERYKALL